MGFSEPRSWRKSRHTKSNESSNVPYDVPCDGPRGFPVRAIRAVSWCWIVFVITVGIGVLVGALLLIPAVAQSTLAETQLALSLSTDSTRWAAGDRVWIRLTVKNVSAAPALFFASPVGHSVDFVTLRADDGTVLRAIPIFLLRPPVPSRGDFLSLGPGEEWSFGRSATLREQVLTDYGTQGTPVIRGLFLDFGDSAIHIPGSGKYTLTGRFAQGEGMNRVLEGVFNLGPLWHGVMTSSSVAIEVP
jgi:hypothetical protein